MSSLYLIVLFQDKLSQTKTIIIMSYNNFRFDFLNWNHKKEMVILYVDSFIFSHIHFSQYFGLFRESDAIFEKCHCIMIPPRTNPCARVYRSGVLSSECWVFSPISWSQLKPVKEIIPVEILLRNVNKNHDVKLPLKSRHVNECLLWPNIYSCFLFEETQFLPSAASNNAAIWPYDDDRIS